MFPFQIFTLTQKTQKPIDIMFALNNKTNPEHGFYDATYLTGGNALRPRKVG